MPPIQQTLALLRPQLLLFWLIPLAFSTVQTPLVAHPNHGSIMGQTSGTATGETTTQKATTMIQNFASGNYEAVRSALHSSLQAEWSTTKLAELWSELVDQTGNVETVLQTKVVNTIMGDLVYVCTTFERYSPPCSETATNFVVTFNTNSQIVGMDFPKIDSIEVITEKFINHLGAGDFAAARGYLHPNLKEEVFPQQIQEQWVQKEGALGQFEDLVTITSRPGSNADGITILEVTLKFERGVDSAILVFDDDKRILNFNFVQ